MKFKGRHRSLKLAERHRKELERETGSSFTMERRDKRGRFNGRGRFYTFRSADVAEWLVTVSVHSKSIEGTPSHQRSADFLVPAPATATEAEVWDILWSLRRTIPAKERWILKVPEEWMNAAYIKTGAAPKFKDRIVVR